MQEFYSHGKLLLAGEYVVLDGALAFAIPTKYGQSLTVESINKKVLHWKSLDEKETIWFEHEFELKNDDIIISADYDDTTKRLSQILNDAKTLNPNFLKTETGFKVTTSLTFPRE
ncbi:MAG: GHMP kinase, partial [Algibacter sp.]